METLIDLLENEGLKVDKRKNHLRVSNKEGSMIFLDQNKDGELLNVFSLKKKNCLDLDGVLIKDSKNKDLFITELFPVISKKHFCSVSDQVSSLLKVGAE